MIKERVELCLKNIGCIGDFENVKELPELIQDSIMFITFIVELEREFNIEIPDERLLIIFFQTLDDVYLLIEELTGKESTI